MASNNNNEINQQRPRASSTELPAPVALELQQTDNENNNNNDQEDSKSNTDGGTVDQIEETNNFLSQNFRMFINFLLIIFYNIFLGYACFKSWNKTESFCDGVKLLVMITVVVYLVILKNYFISPFLIPAMYKFLPIKDLKLSDNYRYWLRIIIWLSTFFIIFIVVSIQAWNQPERLVSVAGYFGFMFLGFICSKHRQHINWKQVLWGFTIQMLFGIFVLRTAIGQIIFLCIGDKVNTFLAFTKSGTRMVFGYLITGVIRGTQPDNYTLTILKDGQSFEQLQVQFPSLPLQVQHSIFALTGLPVIIFFSFFVSILYHYGVMQIIVKKFGSLLQATIDTTPCESISASGNIFLGMCESPLLVKPFLPLMTKSELHAIMTGGFATIAGSVMAAYISFGIPASHLLSASVMAAPSALALSKLFYPETEKSRTSAKDIKLERGSERNAIEAGSNGAIAAVSLIANILANLIAFVSCLAFLDSIIQWFGAMVEIPDLSFKMILSKLFIPVAMMLGVEWADSDKIAGLIGIKMFINEFVAYQELANMIENNLITIRSQTIATFALCGFANLTSIGIQIGTLSTLAPERASDLAEMAFGAMITGSVACFMTACVAGMLI